MISLASSFVLLRNYRFMMRISTSIRDKRRYLRALYFRSSAVVNLIVTEFVNTYAVHIFKCLWKLKKTQFIRLQIIDFCL